jgi:carboxyl-terminal processing protease
MIRYRYVISSFILISTISLSQFSTSAIAAGSDGSTKINEILQMIHSNHIKDVSEEELTNAAIKGMVDYLDDPYTEYFTNEEQAKFLNMIDQDYLGIGITMEHDDKGVYISGVTNESPAEQVGLLHGDYIHMINGKKLTSTNLEQLFTEALSGKVEGNTITLNILRGHMVKTFVVPLKKIENPIVRSKLLPENIGYIALSSFSADADKAFTTALNELESKGMKSLIIDLRNNGGGYIETTKAIASHFMSNQVLMTTRNKDDIEKPTMVNGGTKSEYPIIIMVNQYSASASEVFTGAMQDYKLAKIVGVNTYGKGVTQNMLPVYNGGSLKITTEEYFTPNHHPVNHVGIKPDIEARGEVEQMIIAYNAAGAKKVHLKLTKNDYTLNQIQFSGYGSEAFIVKGKDIFVPARLIISILDGNIKWNNATKSMAFTKGNIKVELPINSKNTVMRNGVSYVSASYIQSKFPQLNWAYKNNTVTLEASH